MIIQCVYAYYYICIGIHMDIKKADNNNIFFIDIYAWGNYYNHSGGVI